MSFFGKSATFMISGKAYLMKSIPEKGQEDKEVIIHNLGERRVLTFESHVQASDFLTEATNRYYYKLWEKQNVGSQRTPQKTEPTTGESGPPEAVQQHRPRERLARQTTARAVSSADYEDGGKTSTRKAHTR